MTVYREHLDDSAAVNAEYREHLDYREHVDQSASGKEEYREHLAKRHVNQPHSLVQQNLEVAVVVPCHNYGRYLAQCLESVLAQTRPAREVVVVDDASNDDTRLVARRFADHGVTYVRIDRHDVMEARKAGFYQTTAPVVCFLDADDILPSDYLEQGLNCFDSPNIGIVYSDCEYFGAMTGRTDYPKFDPRRLHFVNYIHAGSLVLRQAVEMSNVWRSRCETSWHGDWFLWRRVVDLGWQAKKQPALYRYRRHRESMSINRAGPDRCYFCFAGLQAAEVTIFTPLSGRTAFWAEYAQWLKAQTWPRHQTRLMLCDTAGDEEFAAQVRGFLVNCDYSDIRYLSRTVGEPGLADLPRSSHKNAVRMACSRIYNCMAREVTTPWVLIVEDDILPKPDVIEQLLHGFDEKTVSVAAPYRSRYHDGYVAYEFGENRRYQSLKPNGGLAFTVANGFGCTLLRSSILQDYVFAADGPVPDFDLAFYRHLQHRGWRCKIDWRQECVHRTRSVKNK
jgi:glycosyltransferase involved in cell wall biosynthesis